MPTDKIHISIDASSLSHSACILDYKLTVVDGYKETRQSAPMVYGTAIHKFIDTMFKTGGDLGKSLELGINSFRVPKSGKRNQMYLEDEKHFISSCHGLWYNHIISGKDTYKIMTMPDGTPATEINFSIPFYEDDILVVNLSGTIDKLGQFNNGGLFAVGDWKTSSSGEPEIHVESYDMAAQLRMYTLALRLMYRHFPSSILGTIGAGRIGAFIDGIYIRPKASDNEYARSDVYEFSDRDIAEFEVGLNNLCHRLSKQLEEKIFPREGILNGSCKKGYGKCTFYNYCRQEQPHLKELILKRDLKQESYNPLSFHD